MHALAVINRRTLCENVDSAKIKVPFYTTDINTLHVASMHRIIIHCIDISIHIDESLHLGMGTETRYLIGLGAKL